jgi:hypothetical protein
MSMSDKRRCQRCTHPKHCHSGTHHKWSKTACTKDLGGESSGRQIKCSCRQFKEVQPGSPDFKLLMEAAAD